MNKKWHEQTRKLGDSDRHTPHHRKRPHHRHRLLPLKSAIQRKTEGNDVVGNVIDNIVENVVEKLNDRQKRILQAIKNNPAISASTLSKSLGFNHRTIQRDLKHMQELSIIVHEGPDKGGTWKLLKWM